MASKEELKKGSVAMNMILNGIPAEAQEEPETTEKTKAKRTNTRQEKADTGQSEKPQKGKQKVFSFWADVETQKEWRAYAEVKRLSVSDLGRKAIAEYISRHKLTEDEKKLYDWLIGKK